MLSINGEFALNINSLENIVHRCYKHRNSRPTVLKFCRAYWIWINFRTTINIDQFAISQKLLWMTWPTYDTLIDCYDLANATLDSLLSIRTVFGSRLDNFIRNFKFVFNVQTIIMRFKNISDTTILFAFLYVWFSDS